MMQSHKSPWFFEFCVFIKQFAGICLYRNIAYLGQFPPKSMHMCRLSWNRVQQSTMLKYTSVTPLIVVARWISWISFRIWWLFSYQWDKNWIYISKFNFWLKTDQQCCVIVVVTWLFVILENWGSNLVEKSTCKNVKNYANASVTEWCFSLPRTNLSTPFLFKLSQSIFRLFSTD